MPEFVPKHPALRRRLASMLVAVAVLVLANVVLFERQQSRIETSAATLAGHVELYKLSRRIQTSIEAPLPDDGRGLARFRREADEFDRDLERLADVPLGLGFDTAADSETAVLLEGLAVDWTNFRKLYRDLRSFDTKPPSVLVDKFVRVAGDLQASVIAVNFTVQRERRAQFEKLRLMIYGLAAVDVAILMAIHVWARRRVITPVERITAAARRLADADFAAHVDVDSDDEIGELGRVLNTAVARVQGLLADVRHESDALRESEAKFRSLAESSLTGIYLVQDGLFAYVNPRFAQIFGYSTGELVNAVNASSLVHPDDRRLVAEQLRRRDDGEAETVQYEFRGLHRSGRIVPVEVIGSRGSYRGRPAVIGTLLDLSESRRAENEILKLSRAVEQCTATVVITDRQGRIEYVNPKFTALTGYSAAEAVGATPRIVQSGQTPPETYAWMWSRLLAGQEWQGEILNRKKSGELFWEHMVASPVRDAGGEITHFIAVKEDISERKRAEAELRRLNRTLQVLSACNQSLVHAETVQNLAESICLNLVRLGGFPLACIAFADDPEARSVRLIACAGHASDYAYHWSDAERGSGNSGECIRRREVIIARDIATDTAYENWRDEANRFKLASSIALPLIHGSEVLGALRIYSADLDAFTPEEVKLIGELADDLAYGLLSLQARDRIDAQATELMIRQRALESSRNGVMITRCDRAADNPIIYVNAAFEKITGYSRGDVDGRNARFLIGDFWEQPEVERMRDSLRRGGEVEVTLRNVRRDGTMFWNDLSLSPVRDSAGHVTHFISVINDVSDRVRYEQELQHHVTHDTLTGLANRTLLGDRIEQALAHASRSRRKAAVLMIDLDRFKLINDSLGHGVGDELLRQVADRLAKVVRKGDTVARVGSDEFVIVLAEIDSVGQAPVIATKIEEVFQRPYLIGGQDAFVSASIGISVGPDDGSDAATVLRNAEVAMHAVKGSGGSAQRSYAQSMGEVSRDRIGLETDLRHGIERGELVLYYQPKVSLGDGRLVGAEALIRWRHPERGLVPPMQFIPLAEETGLIGPIGDWVIEEALRQLRQWTDAGLPTVKIAVNLSARQFREPELVARIKAMLVAADVAPQLLELELTETMLMKRGEATVNVLEELHGAGMSLAIDDFGTGYSSLSYLQRFPIDTLKIDRSFVKDLERSSDSCVLAETILMMARKLGKHVVAEGVETSGQADILRAAGGDVVQGFLYSPPVPLAEFSEMLRRGFLLQKKAA